jgi:hypothetical protein
MKPVLAIALGLGLVFGSYNFSVSAATNSDSQNKLSQVQKVYVGEMGRTDEARRFVLLLKEQLGEQGFTTVDKPEDADAILTGALSVRVDDGSEARVYVTVKTLEGEALWARDFGNGLFKSLFTLKEPVKLRAEEVARALRDKVRKAGRK